MSRAQVETMNPESLEAQILSFLQNARGAQGISETSDDYSIKKDIEVLFVAGLNFLRDVFPNPSIRKLSLVVWDVIAHHVTPVCLGMRQLKTLAFLYDKHEDAPQGFVAVPANWHDALKKNPITELGGLVQVGSHIVDYANERFFEDPENVLTRAMAYEAEYLNTVKSLSPGWELEPYHQKVIAEFPEGLASPKARKVLYSAKPLVWA